MVKNINLLLALMLLTTTANAEPVQILESTTVGVEVRVDNSLTARITKDGELVVQPTENMDYQVFEVNGSTIIMY